MNKINKAGHVLIFISLWFIIMTVAIFLDTSGKINQIGNSIMASLVFMPVGLILSVIEV